MKGKAEKQQQGQQITACVSACLCVSACIYAFCSHRNLWMYAYAYAYLRWHLDVSMLCFGIYLCVPASLHSCTYESFHVCVRNIISMFIDLPLPCIGSVVQQSSAVVKSLKIRLSPNHNETFQNMPQSCPLKCSHPEVQSKSKEFELLSVYSENIAQNSELMYSAQGPCLLRQT